MWKIFPFLPGFFLFFNKINSNNRTFFAHKNPPLKVNYKIKIEGERRETGFEKI